MLWSDLEELGKVFAPLQELERMRRVLAKTSFPPAGEFPAVNIWSSGEDSVVTAEIPGVDPSLIDITVAGSTLTLKGTRQGEEVKGDDESYHRRERWHGQFSKVIDLPFSVEPDAVRARFAKGVLYVDLPRAEAEKPKKILITSS